MGTNGNGGPAHVPAGIPLVNQPFTLKGFLFTISLKCRCGEPVLLVGAFGSTAICQGCKQTVLLRGLTAQGQRLNFDLAVGMAQPDLAGAVAQE